MQYSNQSSTRLVTVIGFGFHGAAPSTSAGPVAFPGWGIVDSTAPPLLRVVVVTPTQVGGSTFIDAPAGVSSSTGSLAETKAGIDAQSGTSSSSGALVETTVSADGGTGTSTSGGTLGEAVVASDSPARVSSTSGSIQEAQQRVTAPTGTSTTVGTLIDVAAGVDDTSGVSTTTGSLIEEVYSTKPISGLLFLISLDLGVTATVIEEPPPVVSGLPAWLVEQLTPRRPLPPPRIYTDRPQGVSHTYGTLIEEHIAPPVDDTVDRLLELALV